MDRSDPQAAVANRLRAAASAMGVSLTDDSIGRLERFLALLVVWRRRMNLVSQTTASEIIDKHIEDSLALVRLLSLGWQVVDLGSGAGFPGIVLALACPDIEVALVESRLRKVSFLRAAIRESRADNVKAVCARAEELSDRDGFVAAFDMAVSRAVWPLAKFTAIARPLLRDNGIAVSMRGPGGTGGDRTVVPKGYASTQVSEYELSGGEKRCLVISRRCFT